MKKYGPPPCPIATYKGVNFAVFHFYLYAGFSGNFQEYFLQFVLLLCFVREFFPIGKTKKPFRWSGSFDALYVIAIFKNFHWFANSHTDVRKSSTLGGVRIRTLVCEKKNCDSGVIPIK